MAPHVTTSPYGPLPPLPETNFVYTALHAPSPPRPPLPDDYITHIDGITGEKRSLKQFIARIGEVGGALCAPKDQGGLAIRPGEQVVGLLSDNCIVCISLTAPEMHVQATNTSVVRIILLSSLHCYKQLSLLRY